MTVLDNAFLGGVIIQLSPPQTSTIYMLVYTDKTVKNILIHVTFLSIRKWRKYTVTVKLLG